MSGKQDRPEEPQQPTAGAVELTENQLADAQGGSGLLLPAIQKVREAAVQKVADGSVKVIKAGDGSV